jgi:hypothetical protein
VSCKRDCEKPVEFPKTIQNRPGLPRIDYRIGSYAELRERMLHLLNQDPALAAWTHRGVDDPGIALLEGTAIVGDILTFYQQLYANEAYLRTAQWRDSVTELVRLLGYRLAPGLGGEATFALAVKGTESVTVPKGFGLKAQLEGQGKPSEFESTQEATAYPHLSTFNLYRPRQGGYIGDGTQTFLVLSLDGIPEGLSFKAGDRVLLGHPLPGSGRLAQSQILTVEESWVSFGTLYLKFSTPLRVTSSFSSLAAYKLGESYRHFGHNAPPIYHAISGTTTIAKGTWYYRDDWEGDTYSVFYTMGFTARQLDMPLDKETKTIAPGSRIVIQADMATRYPDPYDTVPEPYTMTTTVTAVANRSLSFGNVSGPSTVLTLQHKLLALLGDNLSFYDAHRTDIRSINFHEVVGEPLTLRAEHQLSPAVTGNQLYYYGTAAQAQALHGRSLMFAGADETKIVSVTEVQSLAASVAAREVFRRITLDQTVTYADFDIDTPSVTVYGNLVPATQGKTEAEVVLGSGDRRQTFQTFALPKTPLTYLLNETQTPAQVPELTVYVDGIAWQRVDAFFNYGPEDAVYIVREDEDEKSYVQFGDGKNGRRLPSGLSNVSAVFRAGSGAYGPLKDGASPSITGKLKEFEKLYLPSAVAVGAAREDESLARVAAPGKMQSLGRMVSLADIEAEALALPNVLKVGAFWTAPEGVPLVRLTVLTQSGEVTDVAAIRDSMQTYNRHRGPARYPIDVVRGIRQYVYLHIEAGYDGTRQEDDVTAAIKQALGLAGEEGNGVDGADGLFGLSRRQFGQNAHRSQVIGAVQNATGVTWAKLKGAQILALGTPATADPTTIAKPTVDVVQPILAATAEQILALHTAHLTLTLTKDEMSGGGA